MVQLIPCLRIANDGQLSRRSRPRTRTARNSVTAQDGGCLGTIAQGLVGGCQKAVGEIFGDFDGGYGRAEDWGED